MFAPARQHVPDILDCLAQLSNDEVPTPPAIARAMLDLLPDHVWSDPTLRWLDPACKSGVLLREAASRLLVGLADWEPDFDRRREHIYRNMLFGAAITEMTGIISRRTLYCSRDASSEHSVIRFDDEQGNVRFVPTTHDFGKNGTAKACVVCGAPVDLERGSGRENYAYSFIHGTYPTQEMQDMKFDVIVGNPPYQVGTEGHGAQASPLYHLFLERALDMSPRYLTMIVPSRWFSGGMGLDGFRERMIADRRISKMVDHPKLFDCFPGVEIKGGVNYFLWDRDHDGDCEFATSVGGQVVSKMIRDLRDGDGVLIRDNASASIIDRVVSVSDRSVDEHVLPVGSFGSEIKTNFDGADREPTAGSVPVIFNSRVEFLPEGSILKNADLIHRWKVLIPKAGDGHGREESYVLGEPIALAPGSICTFSYIVAGTFASEAETENYAWYLCTKFVRFLVLQRKVTQDVRPSVFRFVPQMDMTRRWTDEDLYEHFGLTDDERAYIEATIKPREPNLSLDSPIPASHLPGGYKYRAA